MAIPLFIPGVRNDAIRSKYKATDLVWSDEFTSINPQKWRYEHRLEKNPGTLGGQYKYQANLNRTAVNIGINRDGTPSIPNETTYGKRFAAWMDNHHEKTHKIINNQLHMGAYLSDEIDPTSPENHPVTGEHLHPYFDPNSGREVDLRKKIYCAWMDSAGIARFNDPAYGDNPYIDPDSPRHAWRYGYFEMDIDFRMMNTPGFRQSWWLMPYCNPDANPNLYPLTNGSSVAGDGVGATGAEIDLFEYEPSDKFNAKQALLMKVPLVFGSEWGRNNVFADQFGYVLPDGTPLVNDLRGGVTTIGLEWTPEYLGFYVNGMEVNRDYHRVPKVAQYFNLTREITAICGTPNTAPAFHPYRPSYESGGWLWGDNAGAYLDRMISDWAKISYIRVWQNSGVNGVWKSPHNTENAIDPLTPSGTVTRYDDAEVNGVRFGVPTRYSPNPTRNDIVTGEKAITVSTTGADDYQLRYQDGNLIWEALDKDGFDIKRVNVDDIDNSSNYVGSSSNPSFPVDAHGSGIYFLTSNKDGGSFDDSQPINVVVGSNSIDKDGVQLPEGGTNTGPNNPTTPTTGDNVDIYRRTGTYLSFPPEAVVGSSFTVKAELAPNEDGTPAKVDDYTFAWTVPAGVEIQGPSDQDQVVVVITEEIAEGKTQSRAPSVDINKKTPAVAFSLGISFTQ